MKKLIYRKSVADIWTLNTAKTSAIAITPINISLCLVNPATVYSKKQTRNILQEPLG